MASMVRYLLLNPIRASKEERLWSTRRGNGPYQDHAVKDIRNIHHVGPAGLYMETEVRACDVLVVDEL